MYVVVKGRISVTGTNAAYRSKKSKTSKIMLHLDHACQKSITHL